RVGDEVLVQIGDARRETVGAEEARVLVHHEIARRLDAEAAEQRGDARRCSRVAEDEGVTAPRDVGGKRPHLGRAATAPGPGRRPESRPRTVMRGWASWERASRSVISRRSAPAWLE